MNIIAVNDFFLDITGWSWDEVIGANWIEKFIPVELRDEMKRVLEEIIQSGGEAYPHYENPIMTRKGEIRLISWNNIVLRDMDGSVTGTSSIGEDITEQVKAEEALRDSEKKFRSIFDNATDGILLADMENKKFYMANKTLCDMLGYTPEEITKLDVMDIHPKDDLPYVIEQFEKQSKGE